MRNLVKKAEDAGKNIKTAFDYLVSGCDENYFVYFDEECLTMVDGMLVYQEDEEFDSNQPLTVLWENGDWEAGFKRALLKTAKSVEKRIFETSSFILDIQYEDSYWNTDEYEEGRNFESYSEDEIEENYMANEKAKVI